jgi:hypothetical protein
MIDGEAIVTRGQMPIYKENRWKNWVANLRPIGLRRFVNKEYLYGDYLRHRLFVENKSDSDAELHYVWLLCRVIDGNRAAIEQGGGKMMVPSKSIVSIELDAVYLKQPGHYQFGMRLGQQPATTQMIYFSVLDRDAINYNRRNTIIAVIVTAVVTFLLTHFFSSPPA